MKRVEIACFCKQFLHATLSSAQALLLMGAEGTGGDLSPWSQSSGKPNLPWKAFPEWSTRHRATGFRDPLGLTAGCLLRRLEAGFSAAPWHSHLAWRRTWPGVLGALTLPVPSPGPLGHRKWFLSAPGALSSSVSFLGKSSFLNLWATARDRQGAVTRLWQGWPPGPPVPSQDALHGFRAATGRPGHPRPRGSLCRERWSPRDLT